MLSRRQFIRTAALGSTAALIAACAAPATPAAPAAPASAPTSAPATEPTAAPAAEATVEATAGATAAPEATAALAQPITIRFRTPPWASTQDTRVERQVAFRSVIDSFNAEYADRGWSVQEVVADDVSANITADIEAGNADAYWFNHSEYASRARAGQLLDLKPYLEGAEADFFPWVQNHYNTLDDDKVYALWHNTDTPLYYYNTEKIPTPPATWSELVTMAEKVRAEEGGDKYGFVHPYAGWGQMNMGLYEALGGKMVDEAGAPVAFQEPNLGHLKTMFQHYVDLIQKQLIPESAIANNQQQMMPDVYAGNVYSFAGNSNYHIRQLKPNLPPEEYAKWSAVPLPYPDAAGKGLYVAGGWMIGAAPTEDTAKAEAAAAWVRHATDQLAQANTNKAGAWIPTRPAILAEDPFFKSDPFSQTTLKALGDGYIPPFTNPIVAPMFGFIEAALQRAAKGEQSIDDALKQAETETMAEYEAVKAKQ
jgi:multiple sugar transport system substrate-binding protein